MRTLGSPFWLALPMVVASCRAPEPSAPAVVASVDTVSSDLTVTYREAANVFEILDNVSSWWSGKCDVEYRDYWQSRFGVTAEDEQRFAAYKEIRKRHYPHGPDSAADPTKPGAGLFARLKPPDRFAEAFYGSSTLAEAYSRLAELMRPEDVEALKRFYEAYGPQVEALLAESEVYPEIAASLQSKLSDARAADYYRRIASWYGVTGAPRFTVLYVWWPPVEHVEANNRGSFLIMKYNPVKHREGASRDIEIPVHELMHYLSAHQAEEQKQALGQAFLAGCDVTASVPAVKILEEPLAVVHQKMFLSLVDPARFEGSSSWYGDPWISTFAKLIYDPVSRAHAGGGKIDGPLMTRMARSCAQLKAVGALFAEPRAK